MIACNRHRDSLAKKVSKAIKAKHTFPGTLSTRLIKGHIKYLSFAPLRYGYGLKRSGGTWTVIAPIEFHWPAKWPKRLDIPMALADKLGMGNTICKTTKKKAGHIDRGYVPEKMKVKDLKAAGWNDDEIERFRTRGGFTVDIKVVNLGELKGATLQAYERGKAVWPIRLNHRPNGRATYKAIIGKPHPLYAGLDRDTFVHEFGHWLGLDDEYPEGNKPPDWRKCRDLGGEEYVMCSMPLDMPKTDAKGVYAWIVTRRYAVGSKLKVEERCKRDSECGSRAFCPKAPAKRVCKSKKAKGKACTNKRQCLSGKCRAGRCK